VIVPNNLRLALALIVYAVLALLAWRTMEPDKMRLVVLAILALFAFRTITHVVRERRLASEERERHGVEVDRE
jgi:dipeptide/tripeptide permease